MYKICIKPPALITTFKSVDIAFILLPFKETIKKIWKNWINNSFSLFLLAGRVFSAPGRSYR